MSLSEIKFPKYNIFITKLFNLILTLNPEEQRYLLKNVGKLIFKEKRTSARKVCRIPVRYFYNKRIYNNFIFNISLSGCFIEAQKSLLVGEKILMDMQLDGDDKSIRVKGEVTNANRSGMGIEFEEVSSNLLEKLGKLLYSGRII
jgi:Tfp pilus assembly protein PilZ